MKKILYLIMPVALVSMFAFTDTAKAVANVDDGAYLENFTGADVEIDWGDNYTSQAQCEQHECAGWCGTPCWCKQVNGKWVVTHECPNQCGAGEICTQLACQQGATYTCTQQASGCWKRNSSGTDVGLASLKDDPAMQAYVDDIDELIATGGGSGSTQRVSGSCPQGTHLSDDKCCCVSNN